MSKRPPETRDVDEERELKRFRADLDRQATYNDVMEIIMDDIGFRYHLPVPTMVAELKTRQTTWVPEFRARFWRNLTRLEFRSSLAPPKSGPYRMVDHADRLWDDFMRDREYSAAIEAEYREGVYVYLSRVVRTVLILFSEPGSLRLVLSLNAIMANIPTEPELRWFKKAVAVAAEPFWENELPLHATYVAPSDRILEHNEDLYQYSILSRTQAVHFLGTGHYAPWPLPGFRGPNGPRSDAEILLKYHRQSHVELNSWLIASGNEARRMSMQRHMFRYIPDHPDGSPDFARQGVFLTASATTMEVPSEGRPPAGIDISARLTNAESHPRPHVDERIDDAGTGPDHFALPWRRIVNSVNLYELPLSFDHYYDNMSVMSVTRPIVSEQTMLYIEHRTEGFEMGDTIARNPLQSVGQADGTVVYMDGDRPVMSGTVFAGTDYTPATVSVTCALFVNSIHLDNLLTWLYRIADEMRHQAPLPEIEAHHRGILSLIAATSANPRLLGRLRERPDMVRRPHMSDVVTKLIVAIDDTQRDPPRLRSLDQWLLDWAFTSDYDGMLTDITIELDLDDTAEAVNSLVMRLMEHDDILPKVHFASCVECGAASVAEHECTACGLATYCSAACRTKNWDTGAHRLYCIRFAGHVFDREAARLSPAYLAFQARWSTALVTAFASLDARPLNDATFQRAFALVTEGRTLFLGTAESLQEIDHRTRDEAAGIRYNLLRQLWFHMPNDEKRRYLPRKGQKRPASDESVTDSPKKRPRPMVVTDVDTLLHRLAIDYRLVPPEIKALLADYNPTSINTMERHIAMLRLHAPGNGAIAILSRVLHGLFRVEVQSPLAQLVNERLVWVGHYPRVTFFAGESKRARLYKMHSEYQDLTRLVDSCWNTDEQAIDGAQVWNLYSQRIGVGMVNTLGPTAAQRSFVIHGDILNPRGPALVQAANGPLRLRTPKNYPHRALVDEMLQGLREAGLPRLFSAFVTLFPRALLSIFPTTAEERSYLEADQAVAEYSVMLGGSRSWLDTDLTPETIDDEPLERRAVSGHTDKDWV